MSEPRAGPFRTTYSMTPSFQGSLVGCLWWECRVVMHWMTMYKHGNRSLSVAASQKLQLTWLWDLSSSVETRQALKLRKWAMSLQHMSQYLSFPHNRQCVVYILPLWHFCNPQDLVHLNQHCHTDELMSPGVTGYLKLMFSLSPIIYLDPQKSITGRNISSQLLTSSLRRFWKFTQLIWHKW